MDMYQLLPTQSFPWSISGCAPGARLRDKKFGIGLKVDKNDHLYLSRFLAWTATPMRHPKTAWLHPNARCEKSPKPTAKGAFQGHGAQRQMDLGWQKELGCTPWKAKAVSWCQSARKGYHLVPPCIHGRCQQTLFALFFCALLKDRRKHPLLCNQGQSPVM